MNEFDQDIDWAEMYNVPCESCNLIPDKYVYVVLGTSRPEHDCSFVSAVFETEEDAEAYCKHQMKIDGENYVFSHYKQKLEPFFDVSKYPVE